MRQIRDGFNIQEEVVVEFTSRQARETCRFYAAGSYNAAYLTSDGSCIPKIRLCELNQTEWDKKHGASDRNMSNIMDDPDRCVRLWNTYVRPRLLQEAMRFNIPLNDPALLLAEICYFILNDGRWIKAWVPPFLKHSGAALTDNEIECFNIDTYRGYPELNIPGGRFLADAIIRGNIIRWHSIMVTPDPGALYDIVREKTLHREPSEASLDTWFKNDKKTQYEQNFFRERTFRRWFAEYIFKQDQNGNYRFDKNKKLIPVFSARADNQLLLAAICYLAKHHPHYLDLSILTRNASLKRECAYLFLSEASFKDFLPNFNFDEVLKSVRKFFPNILACAWVKEVERMTYKQILMCYRNELAQKDIIDSEAEARKELEVPHQQLIEDLLVDAKKQKKILFKYQVLLARLQTWRESFSQTSDNTRSICSKLFDDVPARIEKLCASLPSDVNAFASINLEALAPKTKRKYLPAELLTCIQQLEDIQIELLGHTALEGRRKNKIACCSIV